MRPVVEALMSLRGIDLVAAMTLVAEIGDFHRFARPRELMGFLGLVPSEYSSGTTRRQGAITKTGNSHARRVLVEAAWNYRFPARMSRACKSVRKVSPKWCATSPGGRSCASPALPSSVARKLALNKICVAIARELSGFVWDIARQIKPLA